MPKSVQLHLAALFGFCALTLVMTLPVATVMTTHVAGTGGDPWQTMWRFEDSWRRAQDALWPANPAGALQFLQGEFFGGGEPRLVNLSVWPWMWLHVIFEQPLAYNIVYLLSFILSGYAMYLLVRYMIKEILEHKFKSTNVMAAWLAGVAYMFLPYHVAHAQGHFGAMQLQWLPLAVLGAAALVRRPSMGRVLALAAVLVVQAWAEHHYLLWLLLLAGIAVPFFWARLRKFVSSGGLAYAAVLAALLFFFIWLPYWPTVRMAAQRGDALALGLEQTIRFSADPFAYVTPAVFHPIWGGLSWTLFGQNFTGNTAEATQFLGLLPILLVIFFYRDVKSRIKYFWLAAAIFFLVVSFGPRLHLLRQVTVFTLPWALVGDLPVFSAVRAVARAGAVVGLAWMVLFGLVLAGQLHRRGSGLVVLAVLLLEFLFVPAAVQSAAVPEAYVRAAALPGRTLVEIPAATNYVVASRGLYGTLVHGKQMVGNVALERGVDVRDDEALAMPILRQLLYLRTQHLQEDRPEFFHQDAGETLADVWRWIDARVIVVHRDSLSNGQLAAVEHILRERLQLPREVVQDTDVYSVPGNVRGDGVFAARDARWEHVGYDPKRDATFGEVPGQASLWLYNVEGAERAVELKWRMADSSTAPLTVLYQGTVATRTRQSGETVRVRVAVPPGKSELLFRAEGRGTAILQDPALRVVGELERAHENTDY